MGLIVGLQDRVDDFMRPFTCDDDGQWYFKTRDMEVPLPVTEEQVNQAEDSFRLRFKIATAASWMVILGVGAWVYVQVLMHDRYWPALALLPVLYVSFVFYFWANMSATRSLRRRLLELNVKSLRGVRGPKPSWAKLPPRKILVRQLALCWAMFAFFSALSGWMYRNNVRALHGATVSARVIQPPSKQECQVAYEYVWEGQTYKDSFVSCPIRQSHPIGSALDVRVDPTRPQHSVEPTQSPWPPEILIPILLGVLLILGTVAL